MSWRKPLARPMKVTDQPSPLRTLRDAGNYLEASFAGVTHDEALVATVEALMDAAASGRPQSVTAATDQLESFLHAQRRIRALTRPKAGQTRIAKILRRRLDGDK